MIGTRWIVLVVFLLNINAGDLLAQVNTFRAYHFQLDLGVESAFHFNPPEFTKKWVEGGIRKSPATGIGMEVSLYRNISERSEIKVGAGYHQISFLEKTIDPLLPNAFEKLHTYRFMTFAIGHRMTFSTHRNVKPFFESNMVLDVLMKKDPNIRRLNCNFKFDAGILIELDNSVYLNVNAFFKTASDSYHLASIGQYKPYSYGLEFGLGKRSFSRR